MTQKQLLVEDEDTDHGHGHAQDHRHMTGIRADQGGEDQGQDPAKFKKCFKRHLFMSHLSFHLSCKKHSFNKFKVP